MWAKQVGKPTPGWIMSKVSSDYKSGSYTAGRSGECPLQHDSGLLLLPHSGHPCQHAITLSPPQDPSSSRPPEGSPLASGQRLEESSVQHPRWLGLNRQHKLQPELRPEGLRKSCSCLRKWWGQEKGTGCVGCPALPAFGWASDPDPGEGCCWRQRHR